MSRALVIVRAGCGRGIADGHWRSLRRVAPASAAPQCGETPQKKAKKSMFGNMLGGIADSCAGPRRGAEQRRRSLLPVGSMLSDAIINLLDCKEQQQAAKATDKAIRGGVGTEVAWSSESRPNVSGKSKVTGEEQLADGGQCMTVTDIVIVDGEETTVPKRMCRGHGRQAATRRSDMRWGISRDCAALGLIAAGNPLAAAPTRRSGSIRAARRRSTGRPIRA